MDSFFKINGNLSTIKDLQLILIKFITPVYRKKKKTKKAFIKH